MVAERRHSAGRVPFFSICIPQFNRTSFLLGVLRSIAVQDTDDFEVCVSDDCSTDGRGNEVIAFLQDSGMAFVYRRSSGNMRYDGNLRSAIDLASGRYLFLLGNDDVLKDQSVLSRLRQMFVDEAYPAVAITNFEDFATGRLNRRIKTTQDVGGGAQVAAASFRKFSFVSGVVLAAAPALALRTTRWDGSEMYQMYIGSRMIADGGRLFETNLVTVRKDLQLEDERVDSYARRPRLVLKGIPIQRLPFDRMGRLVFDAIGADWPVLPTAIVWAVLVQYLGFQYLYWLFEYRRVQSWRYAAGVSRSLRPSRSLAGTPLNGIQRWLARAVYGISTLLGLSLPTNLLGWLRVPATRVARRFSEWSAAARP